MLVEQRDVRQNPGELPRRLFWNATLDLAVWFDVDGTIDRFQLSYDPEGEPRALTWSRKDGFSHAGIDIGNDDVLANRSPLLRPAQMINATVLRAEFLALAREVPTAIRAVVDERLGELSQL